MGVQRSLFAVMKHIVPSDLEYYLAEIDRAYEKLEQLGVKVSRPGK